MSKCFNLAVAGAVLAFCVVAGVGVHVPLAQGSTLRAASSRPVPVLRVVGRYQLQDIHGTPYLIDTETGRVWFSHPVAIPGRTTTISSGSNSIQLPGTRNLWTEDSPEWARQR